MASAARLPVGTVGSKLRQPVRNLQQSTKGSGGKKATDKAKEAVGGLKDKAGDKLKGLFGD